MNDAEKPGKINFPRKEEYTFDDLVEIMRILRSENGCPWDRVQTHKSIRADFIEETYEAVEGIDTDNADILREELGDVLLQVVFHAQIGADEGKFDISRVITGICAKLIYCHPHVFTTDEKYASVTTSEQVLDNWNALKMVEKGQKNTADELSSVSKALPSLMRGEKLCKKLRKADTQYPCGDEQLESALSDFTASKDKASLGKLLFTVCARADELKIDAEEALCEYNNNIVKENNK